jgi:hypothetical protein
MFDANTSSNALTVLVKLSNITFHEYPIISYPVATCGHANIAKLTDTFWQLFVVNEPETLDNKRYNLEQL